MSDPVQDRGRRGRLSLGRLLGFPLHLSWNWTVIAAVIMVLFGPQVARLFPELGVGAYGIAVLYAVLLALSVLIHELAHALCARRFGWPVTEIVLNLWGGHTQFGALRATPWTSLVSALAGPAANVVIALVIGGGTALLEPDGVARMLLDITVYTNWLVAAFNALPGLPLDGGRIVESAVWAATGSQDRGTVAAGWTGRLIVIGLGLGVIAVPALQGALPEPMVLVVLVGVGAMLWMGASEAIRAGRLRLRIPSLVLAQLMVPATGLSQRASVASVLQARAAGEVVLVDDDGRPTAVVTGSVADQVPAADRSQVPASAVARVLHPAAVVPQGLDGHALIDHLEAVPSQEHVVLDPDGAVVGLLNEDQVLARLARRS